MLSSAPLLSTSSRRSAARCGVVALVVATMVGCGGSRNVRSTGERLPANGAAGAPASTLPTKPIAKNDWTRLLGERLKPTCNGREGVRTADADNLEGAGKIIGTWTAFNSSKGKSRTADGKRIGAGPEPTRSVDTIGLTCAAGGSTIQVNGVQYPFDVAWVVSGIGTGRSLSGTSGAGRYAMIQAISYADKRVIFAKVYVPSDANDDTDDTVIISSLASYLPESPDEPVVHAVSDRDDPELETFVFAKGATEGISLRVPEQDPLGRARYLSVGKFTIAQ